MEGKVGEGIGSQSAVETEGAQREALDRREQISLSRKLETSLANEFLYWVR